MPTSLIEIKRLKKSFSTDSKENEVLKDLSLTFNRSAITGIIGRSGAGKSTLIRCLTLLDHPDSGEILFNNQDILLFRSQQMIELRRTFGFVPQSPDLLNSRTTAGNIALPLELIGTKKEQINQRVFEVAHQVGLSDKLGSYPRQLSGGQKQRALIARALITNPSLLICDEFTSALDPETTLDILALLLKIRNSTGLTIVLITHDMSVLVKICDFIYVLDHGNLVDQGDVPTLLNISTHPVTRALLQERKPL